MTTPLADNPLKAEKRRKLNELLAAGICPYPAAYAPNAEASRIKQQFADLAAGDVNTDSDLMLAGRVMTIRDMGKAAFFTIQDATDRIQIYLKLEELPAESRTVYRWLDIGDWVGVRGYVFRTRKNEISIHTRELNMLCKTLEVLPEKYHGLTDVETKYRHRHLDLIMSPESREVFGMRSRIIQSVRDFLVERGFLEVETPVLQPIYGGAAAYPFATHHRALDMKLFLKISPELYLKRLIVGGFPKVFEIGRNFRNEGIDRTHNPEFTMLEFYEAFTDYYYQMQQFEELVNAVTLKIKGSLEFEYQGRQLNLKSPWQRYTVVEAIHHFGGFKPDELSDADIKAKGIAVGLADKDLTSRGQILMGLFEALVEPHLWQPTIIYDYPVEVSPLTKAHREKPGFVERFEPYMAGMEIGNAYSELNDPVEQRRRLEEQDSQRVIDEEAQPMDEDFLHAIEVGMPPTGGVGIGLERLIMILTDQPSIRDILLFPTMKFQND